jgi:hypothetical protein
MRLNNKIISILIYSIKNWLHDYGCKKIEVVKTGDYGQYISAEKIYKNKSYKLFFNPYESRKIIVFTIRSAINIREDKIGIVLEILNELNFQDDFSKYYLWDQDGMTLAYNWIYSIDYPGSCFNEVIPDSIDYILEDFEDIYSSFDRPDGLKNLLREIKNWDR